MLYGTPRDHAVVHLPFGDVASTLMCLQCSGIYVFENFAILNPFSLLQGGGILLLYVRQGSEA